MSRYLTVQDGVIVWSDTGAPCLEIGVNVYSAFERLRRSQPLIHPAAFRLAAKYGLELVRISFATVGVSSGYTYWQSNATQYKAELRQILDAAADYGLGVWGTLFWNWKGIPEASGVVLDFSTAGAAATTITNLNAAWTSAGATRTNAAAFVADIVGEFVDHPAMAAWEIGNEWADSAWNQSSNFAGGAWGYGSSADGSPSVPAMRTAIEWVADQIRLADSDRLISSGNGTASAQIPAWTTRRDRYLLDNPSPVDCISIHPYPGSRLMGERNSHLQYALADLKAVAGSVPIILGEFGANSKFYIGGRSSSAPYEPIAGTVYWESDDELRAAVTNAFEAVVANRIPVSMLWDLNLPFDGTASNATWYNQDGWVIWDGEREWLLEMAQQYQQQLDEIARRPRSVSSQVLS